MNKSLKRWMIIAMLLAMAVILGYIESFIPIFIPGVKLGLANVIILIMLYEFKFYEAFIVDILRILVVALIRATLMTPTFFMSLSGGILSFIVMLIFSRIKVFSIWGVSMLGSIAHGIGQILVVSIIYQTVQMFNYVIILSISGIISGLLMAVIVSLLLRKIPKSLL